MGCYNWMHLDPERDLLSLFVLDLDVKKHLLSILSHGQSWWPGLMTLSLILLARALGLFQGLELATLDRLLRWRPAEPMDERILIVGIDEADIQHIGTYPLPDAVLALLLQRLQAHQPRVIGVDIYRDLPVPPGHETLVETLTTSPRVVGIEKVTGDPIAPPPDLPPEQIGFADLPLDPDGFVRRLSLGAYAADGKYHFAFALRLAQQYLAMEGLMLENGQQDPAAMRFGETELSRIPPGMGGYGQVVAPSDNQLLLNFRSGPTPFRIVSLRQVMAGAVDPAWVEDAIVLIGVTSLSVKDLVNSAAIASKNPGQVYGVEVHAHGTSQIVNAVLEGRPLLRAWPEPLEYGWILGWGCLGCGVALTARRLTLSLLVSGLLIGLVLAIGVGLSWLAIWVPTVVPAIAFIMTHGATTSLRVFQFQQQQQMTLRLLGQQTSPEVAQALWENRNQLIASGKLAPQLLTATLLFSDIRSFTQLSEQQSPQMVMAWLNDYFIAMTEEVQRSHGVVNKFLGDGLMAVFGVPVARTTPAAIAQDAQQAVECALAMATRLETLNQIRQCQGLEPIQIRIGIFTGPVVVGSLGGQQRLEYGVIGDSVNTAARLEGCEKHRQSTPCRILIAQETLVHLDDQFKVEAWGAVPLRGKQKVVQVYRVLGRQLYSE
jgi:CHASE2 domain-containing sensor protein/class 3 adenylate cyclase